MSRVALEHLTKRFGDALVIDDLNLEIADRQLTVFVGPSGCGKSTLLRLIAGLESATAGEIVIGDRRVTALAPARRGIAMVFQSYALYPHMNVHDNMAFGLKLAGERRSAVEQRVQRAARILQIESLLRSRPRELSGGQRQRVAIGRAIVREPEVFLFDEPLSNLDAALRVQMRLEISRLQQRLGATMIYVTHDQVEAMTLGHTLVVLNAGRIEQVGTPLALYNRPANRFVAGFIGSPAMNFIELDEGNRTIIEALQRAAAPLPAQTACVGIRPEHIQVGDGPIEATVEQAEALGSESYLHSSVGRLRLTARVPGEAPWRAGDALRLAIPLEKLHAFDRDGRAV